MSEKIRIALDCMGGDLGASVVLAGAELSLTQLSNVEFLAFGDLATLGPLIVKRPTLHRRTQIVHSEIAIRMDQKPAEALRLGRSKSSMALAIDAIKTENDRESATRRLFESGKSRFRGLDTESALELLAILNAAERSARLRVSGCTLSRAAEEASGRSRSTGRGAFAFASKAAMPMR